MGVANVNNPSYAPNGFILIPYTPRTQLTPSIKIKPFISSINMITKQGGFLTLNY
jgi:hypothetical protein